MPRWVCPQCGSGAILGERPRRNATGRYCLPCSAKSKTLVERTCPKLDAARARSSERARAVAEKRREREKEARLFNGVDLAAELRRVWRVAQRVEPGLARRDVPELTLRRSRTNHYTSGRTWPYRRIHMTVGTDRDDMMHVLVHEVAHSVSYARGHRGHGDIFRAAEAELHAECGVRNTRRSR